MLFNVGKKEIPHKRNRLLFKAGFSEGSVRAVFVYADCVSL